jgi:dTDP-4-amino-4,6-dideoxygalactose transaminase
MWARKRIDIGWSDLIHGMAYAALPLPAPTADEIAASIQSHPNHADGTVACLTERSGFDLLLKALEWPQSDEILMSAVTIPDMARIIEEHRLTPVPVDLDPTDMSPLMASIERATTPKTRAILIAHLFGAICPMDSIVAWAKPRGILVFEDCAQAYDGDYRGHPDSDVVMFSFGPIKTATALGGGLLNVRDRRLCKRMKDLQEKYPQQPRLAFAKRTLTYSLLKFISGRLPFKLLIAICRLLRRDHDAWLNGAIRNVPGDFFTEIRQQPSPPLLRLMQRRIRRFDQFRLNQRARKGRRLARILRPLANCPGVNADSHTYWIFPAQFSDTESVIAFLERKGFDATAGGAMRTVAPPPDRVDLEPKGAQQSLENVIYLPVYPEMPDDEIERMGRSILKCETAIVPNCG